jgi:hypothetical protein
VSANAGRVQAQISANVTSVFICSNRNARFPLFYALPAGNVRQFKFEQPASRRHAA